MSSEPGPAQAQFGRFWSWQDTPRMPSKGLYLSRGSIYVVPFLSGKSVPQCVAELTACLSGDDEKVRDIFHRHRQNAVATSLADVEKVLLRGELGVCAIEVHAPSNNGKPFQVVRGIPSAVAREIFECLRTVWPSIEPGLEKDSPRRAALPYIKGSLTTVALMAFFLLLTTGGNAEDEPRIFYRGLIELFVKIGPTPVVAVFGLMLLLFVVGAIKSFKNPPEVAVLRIKG